MSNSKRYRKRICASLSDSTSWEVDPVTTSLATVDLDPGRNGSYDVGRLERSV